jgi:hypothetical protein
MKWVEKVGINTTKLEYPAYFEGGLVGVRAKESIRHREMIISIPSKVLMSTDKAKSDHILGRVIRENMQIFDEEHDYLTLCVFLMFEHQKGGNSLWHLFMKQMPEVIMTCDWDPKSLEET